MRSYVGWLVDNRLSQLLGTPFLLLLSVALSGGVTLNTDGKQGMQSFQLMSHFQTSIYRSIKKAQAKAVSGVKEIGIVVWHNRN